MSAIVAVSIVGKEGGREEGMEGMGKWAMVGLCLRCFFFPYV